MSTAVSGSSAFSLEGVHWLPPEPEKGICPSHINSPREELDSRVDAMYKVLAPNIDWKDIVKTVIEAVKEAAQFTQLKGEEKLELVRKTLVYGVKEAKSLSQEKKEEVLNFLEKTLPVVARTAVMVSKSPIVMRVVDEVDDACCDCLPKMSSGAMEKKTPASQWFARMLCCIKSKSTPISSSVVETRNVV